MTDKNPIAQIADMVREAEKHAEGMAGDRERANQYYRGEMKDVPADKGRSSMVTRDVRAHIKKVLPSIMRTLLGGSALVEFQPVGQNDEEGAKQATDYINDVVIEEADIPRTIEAGVHDALLLRNGILKWWWDDKKEVSVSRHTGLTDEALGQLAGDEGTEVLEHTETQATVPGPDGMPMPVTLHDVKIRRTTSTGRVRTAAVPRERLLIHPDATTFDDSLLTGEKTALRRGDLLAMGYDRDLIDGLSVASADDDDDRREEARTTNEAFKANDPIEYYDLFIRVDMDGDGISELRHMVFAGGLAEKNLLLDEECDEVQMCDLAVMRQPHQWEGISLADDLMDIQKAKTVLLRQTLDNLYWQNNPQPLMQDGTVMNPEAVYTPQFGLPIRIRQGIPVGEAYGFQQVPMVADKSFSMMEYLDAEATDRTGVSDASAGLAPDALQNMTAKASAMIEQAGIGQTEMMVRTVAAGLRVFFRGILRLVIRHQDMPRTVRLRDKWVEFDPRHWNAGMDCAVNTGLGAGTRERDMMVMQQVLQLQNAIVQQFGPDNPFVKPDNLYASLAKLVESAGLKTPALYFTEPDPEEIEQRKQAAQNQPNPEQMKLEAQAQLEQMKIQAQMQLEQAKMQTNASKEQAQMQADLQVKQAEIEAESIRQREDLTAKAALQAQQLQWEREKFAMELTMRQQEAERAREDARQQFQAKGFRENQRAAQ